MFADPALLKQTPQEASRFDRQAFRNAALRGASLPATSAPKEQAPQALLLEYAAFLLDQEARYCQQ